MWLLGRFHVCNWLCSRVFTFFVIIRAFFLVMAFFGFLAFWLYFLCLLALFLCLLALFRCFIGFTSFYWLCFVVLLALSRHLLVYLVFLALSCHLLAYLVFLALFLFFHWFILCEFLRLLAFRLKLHAKFTALHCFTLQYVC